VERCGPNSNFRGTLMLTPYSKSNRNLSSKFGDEQTDSSWCFILCKVQTAEWSIFSSSHSQTGLHKRRDEKWRVATKSLTGACYWELYFTENYINSFISLWKSDMAAAVPRNY